MHASQGGIVVTRRPSNARARQPRLDQAAVNLQGIGAVLEAQGFYSQHPKGAPVYTQLKWASEVHVTGLDNFYASESSSGAYPTSEESFTLEFCPDDFGTSRVAAGTYSVTATVRVFNYGSANGDAICSATEPCNGYDKLYEKVMPSTFVLDFSPECYAAKARVPVVTKALKAAKVALKRAKATHKRALIRKKQRTVVRTKAQLVKARSDVDGLC